MFCGKFRENVSCHTNIDIYLESELVADKEDSSLQHFSIGEFIE